MQSGGQKHYTGTIDAWGKIYREEGGKAFFKVCTQIPKPGKDILFLYFYSSPAPYPQPKCRIPAQALHLMFVLGLPAHFCPYSIPALQWQPLDVTTMLTNGTR